MAEVFGLACILVEILEVEPGSTDSNMQQSIFVEHMSHLEAIEVPRRHIALFVITYHLVDLGALLGGADFLCKSATSASCANK